MPSNTFFGNCSFLSFLYHFKFSLQVCRNEAFMASTSGHIRVKRTYSTPVARFSKVPKLFGRISGDIVLFVFSKRRRLRARNLAVILIFLPFTTYEKTSFPNERVGVLGTAFRARKVFGAFEKRATGEG